jgi:23S rRNA pseudouridine2605 synthase
MGIRLNKYIAQCGLGSRRKVESLIAGGRITVNGIKVENIGTIIGPDDSIEMDGRPINRQTRCLYIMLNKPRGYITTLSDEKNRPTVMDLLPEKYKRHGIYPIGRLDKDTGGILLFTNDGDLAYKLTKPGFQVPKGYEVEINRPLGDMDKKKIIKGMYIHQLHIKTKPAQVISMDDSNRKVYMVIREGKNRQIRFTFINLGYKVKRLERTSYGTLTLRNIRKGSVRVLTKSEIRTLKKMAGL